MAKKQTASTADNGQPKYVAYYRVSTQAQAGSGFALQSQRAAVVGFVDGPIIADYTEVSGGDSPENYKLRPKLTEVIDLARSKGAILIVSSFDRLSRYRWFFDSLKDSGLLIRSVDMPDVDPLDGDNL